MDNPEIAVARYAARISLWALGVSAGSLCVAFAVFVLELRRWLEEGVRLSMSVMVGARVFGGATRRQHVSLYHRDNRGSAATTITHMVLFNYRIANR